jgi:hypothetical protein
LLKLEISSDDVFIIGDLNNDMLDTVDNCLKNICNNNGLVNTITKLNRTNPTTKLLTLLDVILCLCNKYLIKSEVFHMPCSDHGLIMSVFNHSSSFNKPIQINSRCLNDKKILSLKTILLSTLSLSNFDRYITVESRWAAIRVLDAIFSASCICICIKDADAESDARCSFFCIKDADADARCKKYCIKKIKFQNKIIKN